LPQDFEVVFVRHPLGPAGAPPGQDHTADRLPARALIPSCHNPGLSGAFNPSGRFTHFHDQWIKRQAQQRLAVGLPGSTTWIERVEPELEVSERVFWIARSGES